MTQKMTTPFNNKVALVTGAAGGIGQAIVTKLIEQGARVIATDYNQKQLEQLKQQAGNNCTALPADLSDADCANSLADTAFNLFKQIDIVVNNAGVMHRGDILSTSDDDWQHTMDINVSAVFRVCRGAIAIMQQNQSGAIVNVASCWGKYPGPQHLAYCTSKAAVAMLTQCLARDHASQGIRINAVCPNEVNTAMLKTGFEIRGLDSASAVEELNKTVPLGRIAEPEDIADVIAFLCSEQARYVCGALVEINGAKPVY